MRSIMKKATTGAGLVAAALGALALAASLSACNNEYPIYGSIQQEQPGSTLGPFYRTTVGKVLAFGGKYYAQRATIASSSDGSTWSTDSIADLGTGYSCTGLAQTSTALWAVIDGKGLYTSGDGTNWTPAITDPASNQTSSAMIDNVFIANDVVFVEAHNENGTTTDSTDDSYSLATVSGSTSTPITLTGLAGTTPITGVAWDGTDYWVITTAGIYFSSNTTTFAVDASAPTGKLDSILASAATPGTIYVGTDSGYVYMHTGSSWTASAAQTYSISALVEVHTSSATFLLVGLGANSSTVSSTSVAYGYVQLDPATLTTTTTSGESSAVVSNATNYDTTLSGKPVMSFLYDSTAQKLFAATASSGITGASGLWITTLTGTSTWSGWSPIN